MKRKNIPFPESSDFFKKNEREQNRVAMRICYYTPIAGIAMLIGCFAGIFGKATIYSYVAMTVYIMVQSVLMKVFCSINPEHPGIKYYIIITTEILVFFLSISKGFSPFIVYALAPLGSCLYFNRKFCFFTSTLSYVAMIASIIIRALPGHSNHEGLSSFQWGLEYGFGLTFEYFLNIGILYLVSLRHLDVLNSNLEAIKNFQTTQNELITGYSELVYQAHQSHKIDIKRCQAVVTLLCEILREHKDYPALKNKDIVDAIISSVPLHDIGLIGVSDAIVSKTTSFTEAEKIEYQKHVVYGEELVRKNFYLSENREFLKIARDATLHHHERWDGSGYPDKLCGPAIPVCARIIAVADELEFRIAGDNEHPAVSFETALLQVQKLSGFILDPVIVEALLSARFTLEELYPSEEKD